MKTLSASVIASIWLLAFQTSAIELPFKIPQLGGKKDDGRSTDQSSSLSNQAKNIIDNVKNDIKKDVSKIEGNLASATSGLTNLTQIGVEAVEQAIDCYENLGCFPNTAPWFSLIRPFPKPMKPKDIDTKIYLYTSKSPNDRYTVTLWNNITIENSDFDPNRPYTAFITHGFSSNGNVSWVSDLKDAYLKNREANVFIVDWGKGASVWNYLQVAANTRIVGAELGRFGKYLVVEKGLDPARIHLMGHSLGAHISSYLAKAIQTVGQNKKVAHLTAFDPAQPGFEGNPDEVRLVRSDAEFVDVIHTNARPVIPLLGFGLILPTGHIDYYMNGGLIQPGCKVPPVDEVKLNSIADLAKYPVEVISSWVACSHGKSYLYYTEALLNNYCTFWGRSAGIIGSAFDIGTLGYSEKILSKFTTCTLDKCSPIGLEALEYPARGIFSASTHSGSPYCFSDPKITQSMKEQRSLQQEKQKSGIGTADHSENLISKFTKKALDTCSHIGLETLKYTTK